MNASLVQTYVVVIVIHLAGIGITFYLWTENRGTGALAAPLSGGVQPVATSDRGAVHLGDHVPHGRRSLRCDSPQALEADVRGWGGVAGPALLRRCGEPDTNAAGDGIRSVCRGAGFCRRLHVGRLPCDAPVRLCLRR